MKIRLNKVQKELNIGLNTIVEFLQKKGIDIKEDPNAVVPEKGYELLMEAFSADKNVRLQSDKFTQERQNKERPKASAEPEKAAVEEKPVAEVKEQPEVKHEEVAKPAEEPAAKEEKEKKVEEPVIKVMRTIDLDALNRRSAKKEKQPEKKAEVKPAAETKPVEVKPAVKEEKPVEPVKVEEPVKVVETPIVDKKPEEPKPQATGFNIVGKIDLSAINQQTRPKKKSKE